MIDGPFAETKELIAGFWLWKVKSLEEAIEYLPVFLITVGQTQVFHRSPQFVVGYPQIAQIKQIKRRT